MANDDFDPFINFYLWGFINSVLEQIEDRFADTMHNFAHALQDEYSVLREQIAKLLADMAVESRDRIVEFYMNTTIIDKAHPYRYAGDVRFRRYAKGAMERALRNDELNTSNATTLYFVDTSILNTQAKQWRRLNFGALPAGRRQVEEGDMKLFGQTTGVKLSLKNFPSSPAFFMPEGFSYGFFSRQLSPDGSGLFDPVPRGEHHEGDAFYIFRKNYTQLKRNKLNQWGGVFGGPENWRRTRGIYGAAFLEEGTKLINREFPKRFEDIVRNFFGNAGVRTAVPPPRPGGPGTLEKVIAEAERATGAAMNRQQSRNQRARAQARAMGVEGIENEYQWRKYLRGLNR